MKSTPVDISNEIEARGLDCLRSMPKALPHVKIDSCVCFHFASDFDLHGTPVDEYREAWVARLREFVGGNNKPSQRQFWRFFDNIREIKEAFFQRQTFAHEIGHAAVG